MNILIAMNSNISYTSGGLERTTLILYEYLNKQEGINCFALFNEFEKDIPFQDKLIKGVINSPELFQKLKHESN